MSKHDEIFNAILVLWREELITSSECVSLILENRKRKDEFENA